MNVKNHQIYSSKIDIRVVSLNCIHLATKEDKKYQIDYWAKLFKATTWKEIRMIAKENAYLTEAANTLYEMNADEQIRQQCQAREDYEHVEATWKYLLAEAKNEISSLTTEKESLMSEKESLVSKIDSLCKLLEENGIDVPQ